MPLVSVVIPTYRRPEMLTRSVSSALNQTLRDLEVVVVVEQDDQDTIPALSKFGDPRVRYVVNPEKLGPGPARDTGARSSKSQWVAFLDDDDEWMNDKLEKQLAHAEDSTQTIVTTLSRVVTPVGWVIRPASPYIGDEPIDEWLFGRQSWTKGGESFLQTSSLLVPRLLFETLRFGNARHEEWEFVIRAIKQHGCRLVTVREPLVTYYTGNTYPLGSSLQWVDNVRPLLSPRAYSGFCLTVAPHHVAAADRTAAFRALFKKAFRQGAPSGKQLFAFLLIWLTPGQTRQRMRVLLRKLGSRG